MTDADLILVGGGLANTLIALRLADAQPDLRVLLLERGDRLGGNHTWSFHGSDLDQQQLTWLEPLIEYSWQGYEVQFPNFTRRLGGTYHSLTSERLHDIARTRLADRARTGTSVRSLEPDRVTLEDDTVLTAGAVIDGRGPAPDPSLDVRYQKFVGLVLALKTPHHLDAPIIMDASQTQQDGYRFFYSLPFDAQTVLIEDTRYSDTPDITSHDYAAEIHDYAAAKGWQIDSVLREEVGVLPITLDGDIDAFWDREPRIPRSGLRAALFHAATGYSLPWAVDLADQLARNRDWSADCVYQLTRNASRQLWAQGRFYRILNRMLFLAAAPDERRHVLARFYGLNERLIRRFYAGRNTLADKIRVLVGKPPVPLARAWDAVFRYEPRLTAEKHPRESL